MTREWILLLCNLDTCIKLLLGWEKFPGTNIQLIKVATADNQKIFEVAGIQWIYPAGCIDLADVIQ